MKKNLKKRICLTKPSQWEASIEEISREKVTSQNHNKPNSIILNMMRYYKIRVE